MHQQGYCMMMVDDGLLQWMFFKSILYKADTCS